MEEENVFVCICNVFICFHHIGIYLFYILLNCYYISHAITNLHDRTPNSTEGPERSETMTPEEMQITSLPITWGQREQVHATPGPTSQQLWNDKGGMPDSPSSYIYDLASMQKLDR